MINLNKKDSVADAVKSILQHEETDVKSRTKDDIGGKKKTTQVDDVGPGADGKSTKVKLAAEETKKLSLNATEVTEKPEAQELKDAQKDEKNKKQLRMKESTTLKGFKARYEEHTIFDQMIAEVLSKDASAGAWIHDFVHSDNPKFAGKSKAERKKQALAAYYAKQRNEEVVDEALKGNQKKIDKNHNGKIDAQDFKILRKEDTVEEGVVDALKSGAKKVLAKVGGGSDEDHLKRLQKDMGVKQTGKKPEVKEETVEEGWDDMVKAAKDSVKSGPKPSGGSGMKQGSRYGGSKQKDKPEHDEDKKVNEGKRPEDDSVPFAPPFSKTPSEVTDKSGAKHTPMSRAHHLARLAMKKVKSDLGNKGK